VLDLPRQLTVVSAPGAVRSAGGAVLTWIASPLEAGGKQAYRVSVRAASKSPATVTLQASVTSAGSVDVYESNNTATATVRVRRAARAAPQAP
jgi:hypothetical protein